MNANKSLIVPVLAAALCAGCGTSPSTQRGAAVGAATGAVIGGVIGHQSGETGEGAALGAAAGGLAGAALGNRADRDRDRGYTTADAHTGYVVQTPPPMPTSNPRDAMPPKPAAEAVWVEGYWDYVGGPNQYQWAPGHWEIPPPGYRTWTPPSWQRSGEGYVYVRGHWR